MIRADVYTFETAGNWNQESNWDVYPGTVIDAGDEVVITADLTVNTFITVNGMIETNSASTLTVDWSINMNGSMVTNGEVINNSQITLFGDGICHGDWENTELGVLIITGTGDFSCYGMFTNNGALQGYNSSKFHLESNFYNNDSFTFNGDLNINQSGGREFVNDGFIQLNGSIRLEGTLVNKAGITLNINPSCTMTVANNSKIENLGTIKIQGLLEMSSLLNAHSTLGNIEVTGEMIVMENIAEIL